MYECTNLYILYTCMCYIHMLKRPEYVIYEEVRRGPVGRHLSPTRLRSDLNAHRPRIRTGTFPTVRMCGLVFYLYTECADRRAASQKILLKSTCVFTQIFSKKKIT